MCWIHGLRRGLYSCAAKRLSTIGMEVSVIRLLVAFSFLLAFAGSGQTAGGGTQATAAEQSLITQTQAVAHAQKSKDGEALKRLLADDFQQVGSEGRLHD